ncbi:MAG: Ig-like domain-containing protein, partial [Acidimicrobiales bacterium]
MEGIGGGPVVRRRILITLMSAALASPIAAIAVGQTSASASPRSCYSTCPSSVRLSLSSSDVTYGSEGQAVFTAKVSPRQGWVPGVPTGTVTVQSGWTTLCTISLSAGTGSCSLGSTQLKASRRPYLIVGRYSGDSAFSWSWSNLVVLKVESPPPPPPPPPPHHRDHFPF